MLVLADNAVCDLQRRVPSGVDAPRRRDGSRRFRTVSVPECQHRYDVTP